jgi:hypothetical protein
MGIWADEQHEDGYRHEVIAPMVVLVVGEAPSRGQGSAPGCSRSWSGRHHAVLGAAHHAAMAIIEGSRRLPMRNTRLDAVTLPLQPRSGLGSR